MEFNPDIYATKRCKRHGNPPTYSGKVDGKWIHLCDDCHADNVRTLRTIFKKSYAALHGGENY